MDHQLDLQKAQNRKYYQKVSLMVSSDPDVIKIHLQSSLSEFEPYKKFSPPPVNGEQITMKGNRDLNTNFILEIQN